MPESQAVPVQSTVGFVGEPGEKVPEVQAIKSALAKKEAPVSLAPASTSAGDLSGSAASPQAATVMGAPSAGIPAVPCNVSGLPHLFVPMPIVRSMGKELPYPAADPSGF